MIINKKTILHVYLLALLIGVVSIVAMQKEDDDQGVESFKGIIRELSCTCIKNKNFPPELSEDSKNAETLREILKICSEEEGLKRVKEIIMTQHCECMNNKKGFFDIEKLPFKVSPTNPKGFHALMKLKGIMEKSLVSIYEIVDQFHINPNIIMPSLESHDHYTTIFGHVLSLLLNPKGIYK